MQEYHGNYITNAIRKLYRRRIAAPALLLLFTVILWVSPQVNSALFPAKLPEISDLKNLRQQQKNYLCAGSFLDESRHPF